MKQFLCVLCVAMLLIPLLCGVGVYAVTGINILPEGTAAMDSSANDWIPFGGGKIEYRQVGGNVILAYQTIPGKSWCSPAIEIFQPILANGSGVYQLELDIKVSTSQETTSCNTLLRCTNRTSHCTTANEDNTEYRGSLGRITGLRNDFWQHFSTTFEVTKEDISGADTWFFCFDSIGEDISYIYLDNVALIKQSEDFAPTPIMPTPIQPTPKPFQNNTANSFSTVTSNKITTDNGKNLIEKASAEFEGISNVTNTQWYAFQGENMVVDGTGYVGNCITMQSVPYSWSSPAINIYQYITEPGPYTVSLMMRVVFTGEATTPSLTLRGDAQNSFIQKQDTQFFTGIGSVQDKIESGQWYELLGTFTAVESDLAGAHNWTICLGGLPEQTVSVSIDSISLIKGAAVLPADENNETEQNAAASKVIFNPLTGVAAIATAAVTVSIVLITISLKIKSKKRGYLSNSSSCISKPDSDCPK